MIIEKEIKKNKNVCLKVDFCPNFKMKYFAFHIYSQIYFLECVEPCLLKFEVSCTSRGLLGEVLYHFFVDL